MQSETYCKGGKKPLNSYFLLPTYYCQLLSRL